MKCQNCGQCTTVTARGREKNKEGQYCANATGMSPAHSATRRINTVHLLITQNPFCTLNQRCPTRKMHLKLDQSSKCKTNLVVCGGNLVGLASGQWLQQIRSWCHWCRCPRVVRSQGWTVCSSGSPNHPAACTQAHGASLRRDDFLLEACG